METAILTAHVAGGVLGLLSGLVAVLARKGARLHRAAGAVFIAALPVNGATAAALGVLHADAGDVFGGLTTVYLVATAWLAVRRKARRTSLGEIAACLAALAAAALILLGPALAGEPDTALSPADYGAAGFYGFLGLADLSVILRGGLAGAQRIARHLWRMLLGFAIAVGSFFPGQLHLFPRAIREIEPVFLLFTPLFFVLALMVFWLGRVLLFGPPHPAPHAAQPRPASAPAPQR